VLTPRPGKLLIVSLGLTHHFLFRLLVLGGTGAIGLALLDRFLHADSRRMVPLVIVSWGISRFAVLPVLVFYTDRQGIENSVSITSAFLVFAFLTILNVDREFVQQFVRTPVFLAFALLLVSTAMTQVWYLGLIPGLGIAFTRVLEPLMVVVLLARLVRDVDGLRLASLSIVVSVTLAILIRYAAGAALGENVVLQAVANAAGEGRVSALGSWTIYGTLCAAMIPLAIALLAIDTGSIKRLLLLAAVVLGAKEVIATGTRGALIGLLAVFVISMRGRARRWAVASLSGLLMAVFLFNVHFAFSGTRVLSLNVNDVLREPNTQTRLDRNLAALHYVTQHPFSGSPLGVLHWVQGQEIGTWVYNPYLAWGTASGLPALLTFALIMLLTIRYAVANWRTSTGSERVLNVGVAAALTVWLINQFTTGDSLTYLQSVEAASFFYALVGIVVGYSMRPDAHPSAPGEQAA